MQQIVPMEVGQVYRLKYDILTHKIELLSDSIFNFRWGSFWLGFRDYFIVQPCGFTGFSGTHVILP